MFAVLFLISGCGGDVPARSREEAVARRLYSDVAGARSMAMDHRGALYVIDQDGKGVCRILGQQRIPIAEQVTDPLVLASDRRGRLYIATSQGRLYRLTRQEQPELICEDMARPSAMTCDKFGNVYLAFHDGAICYVPCGGM